MESNIKELNNFFNKEVEKQATNYYLGNEKVLPISLTDVLVPLTPAEEAAWIKLKLIEEYKKTHNNAPAGATAFGVAEFQESDLDMIEKFSKNELIITFYKWLYEKFVNNSEMHLKDWIYGIFPELLTMQENNIEKTFERMKDYIKVGVLDQIKDRKDLMKKFMIEKGFITKETLGLTEQTDNVHGIFGTTANVPKEVNTSDYTRNAIENSLVSRRNKIANGDALLSRKENEKDQFLPNSNFHKHDIKYKRVYRQNVGSGDKEKSKIVNTLGIKNFSNLF